MNNPQSLNNHPQQIYFNPFEDEGIDFKRYLSLFLSNWLWFAIALFTALCISYGINRWSERVFTVSSSLLIKDDQLGGINSGLTNIFPGTETFRNQQNLRNEIGILKSFSLNYGVVQELLDFNVEYVAIGKRNIAETRMYNKSPFIVVYDSLRKQSKNQKISIKILSDQKYSIEINGEKNNSRKLDFGEKFTGRGFDFKVELRDKSNFKFNPDASNKFYFYFNDPIDLANRYRSNLSVVPIEEEASLMILSVSGFVVDQEVDYLNKLMDNYLKFGLDFKNQTAGQTLNFIENQIKQLSDSLHIAESNLESFRLANKIIDISREGASVQGKLEQIINEKSTIQLQENYYIYLKGYIESKSETEDIIAPSVMGVTDQLLINLVDKFSQLQQGKKQLAMNYNATVEPMKILESNIIRTRAAISENIISGLQNIERTKAGIEEKLKIVELELKKLPSTERQMINIQRKFDISNTVYTYLLEKRAETGIAKASNVPDNIIIDKAGYFSSSRIKPKTRQNLMLAILLGLFLPLLSIILFDYLNNKIIDKKDIEKGTSAPILGFISHNSLKTDLPVFEKPKSTLSESFRSVRTNLKYFVKETKCPVISVSSTISSEGKTFIAVNLGTILAMSDKKVLLIGLDLRKPRIHKIFNLDNEIGMSNFLIGDKKFEDIIVKTEVENLWYAQSGPVPPNPAELIDSAEMVDFIERAKKKYDYIIIDTPPVAIVTDALLVSPVTDFYIFVVRQRFSSKNTLDLVEELHKNENIKRIGIVINDISMAGYYGYGLRYGYSAGYGYYYGYNYYGEYIGSRYGNSEKSKDYYSDKN